MNSTFTDIICGKGDHLRLHSWSGETIYGSHKYCHRWSGGTYFGGTIDGMTVPTCAETTGDYAVA